MRSPMICLASDNFAPAHPLIMEAILEANNGFSGAYGADPWTEEAEQLIQQIFN